MPKTKPASELLPAHAVAALLGISRPRLTILKQQRKIPRPRRIDGRDYWDRAIIEPIANERRERQEAWRNSIMRAAERNALPSDRAAEGAAR